MNHFTDRQLEALIPAGDDQTWGVERFLPSPSCGWKHQARPSQWRKSNMKINCSLSGILMVQVKLFLCLIKHHAMKTYGGLDV
jgi:hypothetical protein